MLVNAALSAIVNVLLLAGIPLAAYAAYQRLRHRRPLGESLERVGLVWGEPRYLGVAAGASLLVVAALLLWPPDIELQTREGSAMRAFAGLGLTGTSVALALL